MNKRDLYLVKDGIDSSHIINKFGERIFNTNYHSITFDLKHNEGYIDLINENKWKLYTQIAQKQNKSRYYFSSSFQGIIEKLKELSKNCNIIILKQSDLNSKNEKL